MVVPEGQVGNKLPLVHVRAYCQTGTRLSIKHFSNGENTFCWVDPLDIGDRVSNDIRIMPRKYVIYHSGLQEAKQHLHDISFSAHLNVPLIRAIFILTSSTFSHEDLFALRDYSKYSCISAVSQYVYLSSTMYDISILEYFSSWCEINLWCKQRTVLVVILLAYSRPQQAYRHIHWISNAHYLCPRLVVMTCHIRNEHRP